jgi:hypothetical protein
MRVWPSIAFLATSFIAAACGGGSETPTAGTTAVRTNNTVERPTACSLISQAEMAEILGGAVATPEAHEGLASTTCRYLPASETSAIYAEVQIEWEAGEAAMQGARFAQRALEGAIDASVSDPLTGLGDEATIIIGGIMMVRAGEIVITIDLRLQDEAREKGTTIARTLLERITPA